MCGHILGTQSKEVHFKHYNISLIMLREFKEPINIMKVVQVFLHQKNVQTED